MKSRLACLTSYLTSPLAWHRHLHLATFQPQLPTSQACRGGFPAQEVGSPSSSVLRPQTLNSSSFSPTGTFPRSVWLQDLCTAKSLCLKGFPPRLYPVHSHPSFGSVLLLEKRPLHIPNETRTHSFKSSFLCSRVLGTTDRHLTYCALICLPAFGP